MTDATHSGFGALGVRRRQPANGLVVSRTKLVDVLLHIAFFLACYRATSMWFGYPSTQNENASVDPVVMQLVLYSIIPLIGCVFLLVPQAIGRYARHLPWIVIALVVALAFSVLFSQNRMASLRGIVAVLIISVPPLLFRMRFGGNHTMRCLQIFAGAASIVNFLYIFAFPGYGIMGGSLAGSARGMFLHKNTFGQFSAVAFLLLVPFPFPRPFLRYSVLARSFASLIALGCVALSLSSTALLLVALGLAVMGLFSVLIHIGSPGIRGYLLLILTTGLILGGYTLGSLVLENVAGSFGKDVTFSGRTEVWEALLTPLAERPVFGHGFAMFRQPDYIGGYTAQIAWGPRSTHNTYLEIALNTGLPVACLLIFILLRGFVSKVTTTPATREIAANRVREAGIMIAIMIGAMSEAGVMLAPVTPWVVMLALLPTKLAPNDG